MITTDINRAEFIGDGTITAFVFRQTSPQVNIPVVLESHIKVYVASVLQTITTHYTVSITDKVATITFVTAPINLAEVLFIREVPFTQETDLENSSQLDAESLESQLDLLANQSQQLNDSTSRVLKFSNTLIAASATDDQSTLNVTSALRANKGLKFDANGKIGVSAFDIDKAEDYVLESKSYATESPAVVNHYNATIATPQAGVYSAKEHAIGTPPDGSVKEWATTDTVAVAGGLYSAKQYAANASATETSVNSVYDTFDDRFLGAHTTAQREVGSANIGLDHDGDALVTGALYYDTTLAIMKVWSGSAWSRMQPTSSDQANINTLSASDVLTDMSLLTATGVIDDMALLGTSAVVADMAILGTSDVVTDMNVLATADVVADMNVLGTADVVADMNVLGTSDVVTDMNLLAVSAVIDDMALLAVPAVITDMDLLGASGVIADMDAIGATGVIADLETVANNLSSINDFADKYRIASSAPAINNDDGDLYYNTATNQLNVHDGSAWTSIGLTQAQTIVTADNSATAMAIALG